jgi:hypothetical protein
MRSTVNPRNHSASKSTCAFFPKKIIQRCLYGTIQRTMPPLRAVVPGIRFQKAQGTWPPGASGRGGWSVPVPDVLPCVSGPRPCSLS